MIKISTILAVALLGVGLASPAWAQEEERIEKQNWTFAGPFGKFDQNQLQRGFQVFKEVCSNCHSARLLAFRNLEEEGGPSFSEAQIKALAATYQVVDAEAEGGKRVALPSDHWPSPFASEQEARDANGGALPPDMSVLAKARGIEEPGFWWIANFFTTYSEGGPDYIHALLNGYHDTPAGVTIPEGKYYNAVFPGHAIGMPPPLSDAQVQYGAPPEGGTAVPLTVEQYSRDVAAFLMWVAEPHMEAQKSAGFRVVSFLILLSVLMFLVKQRLWRRVH